MKEGRCDERQDAWAELNKNKFFLRLQFSTDYLQRVKVEFVVNAADCVDSRALCLVTRG